MRFFNVSFIIALLLTFSCGKARKSELPPEYKMLKDASSIIEKKYGVQLFCYGINNDRSKDYYVIEGADNFSANYWSFHHKDTEISIEDARVLLISIIKDLADEINANKTTSSYLSHYPITLHDFELSISFVDEFKTGLRRGIAGVWLWRGKVKYEKFTITKYTDKYGASGVHYDFHEESYEDALRLVNERQQQGSVNFKK